MKDLPASDPRSWSFQANIHGKIGPRTNPLFKQCEHGTLLFLAWHRGYLSFFERIVRWASGDLSLNLPYWDWTATPALPPAYRIPASSSNPLYDASRAINDGSLLPPQVVVDDLNTALNFIEFPPSGSIGFSRSLEASPHGQVHVLVGGKMSSIARSANDPIFWLHHCNIDRLWDRWLNLGGGRSNPSDSAFLEKSYSFADENGAVVTVKVRDILQSAQLGYRYDNVPNPWPAAGRRLVAYCEQEAPAHRKEGEGPGPSAKIVASSIEERKGEKPPEASESKSLGFRPETVKLYVAPKHEATLRAAVDAASTARAGKILLKIRGLSLSEVPNFTYAVYLNLPESESSPKRARLHYVGTINFFGKDQASGQQNGHHEAKTFDETFDVTAVVARLKRSGHWKAEALSVTLRPLTPIPPKGKEEALRRRSEEAAKRAKVFYKSIDLIVTEGREENR